MILWKFVMTDLISRSLLFIGVCYVESKQALSSINFNLKNFCLCTLTLTYF